MLFFFITTSDSTSLIFDYLSTNGDENHTWLQRCVWSLLQAGLTIMLIWGGGKAGSALRTAQGLCIIASIPNMIMLNIACANLLYSFRRASADYEEEKHFRMPIFGGVLDAFEFLFSLGEMDPRRGAPGSPSRIVWSTFCISLFAPFYAVYRINAKESFKKRIFLAAFTGLTWLGCILCLALQSNAIAFMFYVWFTFVVASMRLLTRHAQNIRGNLIEDVFASFILYPQVLSQVHFQHVEAQLHNQRKTEDSDSDF
jgi:hypothetical protein